MKIELWYDAVAQETDILINDFPVEKNDIYGFLYPVRNYPIQSWLDPNGSWKGIEYQIVDLARDENVNLVFHGRKCDYEDVCKCLSGNQKMQVDFAEWDVCTRYNELFSNLLSTLIKNDSTIRRLRSPLETVSDSPVDFYVSIEDTDWAYHIRDHDDLARADEATNMSCCIVHDRFFSSYEKLHDLMGLTRSLRVPADAIFCCFDQEEAKADYEYYAQSFRRMSFHFCLESTNYLLEAKTKYGLPAIVKLKIKKCSERIKILCSAYSRIIEETQSEFNLLKKNIVSLNQREKERDQNIKLLRDHTAMLRHGMGLIDQYINILLSVSKENKEEVFHYECIDKLDENIRLYLNANSFSEVN